MLYFSTNSDLETTYRSRLEALMRQSKIDELLQQIKLLAIQQQDSLSEFNYWDYTIAIWNPIYVARNKEQEFILRDVYKHLEGEKTNSPYSESKYLVHNGVVFRLSQHWGKCKTCYWPTADSVGEYHTESKLTLAYCRLSDFRSNNIIKEADEVGILYDNYKNYWDEVIHSIK